MRDGGRERGKEEERKGGRKRERAITIVRGHYL